MEASTSVKLLDWPNTFPEEDGLVDTYKVEGSS